MATTVITKKGQSLTTELIGAGYDYEWASNADVRLICSGLKRAARTWQTLQILHCNGYESLNGGDRYNREYDRIMAKEARLQARLVALVDELQAFNTGETVALELSGDPRGFTVRLLIGRREIGLDTDYM